MDWRQDDMFGMPQGDLFAGERREPAPFRPDIDAVRAQLVDLLELARGSQTLPWTERKARYHRTVFPQMADWLPVDEADALRAAFAAELERLGV